MAKLRVALLCPYGLSVPGGVQGQVVGLAHALRRMDVDARVIAPGGDGKPHELEAAYELDLGTIDLIGRSTGIRANGSVAPVDVSPASWLKAARSINKGGYDLLHIHEPFAPGAAYACVFACKMPKIATFHRSGGGALYRLAGPLARYAVSKITKLCAVSHEAAVTACIALGDSYLPGDHARAITVLWNGIDLERYQRASSSLKLQPLDTGGSPFDAAGIPASHERWLQVAAISSSAAGSIDVAQSGMSGAPVVVFVGRHEKRKGLSVLLEAVRMLRARHVSDNSNMFSPVLWVLGHGPETAMLKAEYGDDPGVFWVGKVDDMELARRLVRADVLCVPSLGGESFGVVLLEAMAASTLVVASDIPGYRAVVGEHGILLPPGDPSRLADGLELALKAVAGKESPASPRDIESAYRYAGEYSMDKLAARYFEIYAEVVLNAAR
ncbi:MAG: glycosyltransferase family 4 protein [Acidimicrobiales bacterium]